MRITCIGAYLVKTLHLRYVPKVITEYYIVTYQVPDETSLVKVQVCDQILPLLMPIAAGR